MDTSSLTILKNSLEFVYLIRQGTEIKINIHLCDRFYIPVRKVIEEPEKHISFKM